MKSFVFGIIFGVLATIFCEMIVYISIPAKASEKRKEIVVVRETKRIDKHKLVEAFISIESNGDNKAVNKKTKATGCLQLMPIQVKEANRLIGYNKYKLSDRASRRKSIEIFHVIMQHKNPEYDIHLAAKIWNPRSKLSYHTAIEKKYNELIKQ